MTSTWDESESSPIQDIEKSIEIANSNLGRFIVEGDASDLRSAYRILLVWQRYRQIFPSSPCTFSQIQERLRERHG